MLQPNERCNSLLNTCDRNCSSLSTLTRSLASPSLRRFLATSHPSVVLVAGTCLVLVARNLAVAEGRCSSVGLRARSGGASRATHASYVRMMTAHKNPIRDAWSRFRVRCVLIGTWTLLIR